MNDFHYRGPVYYDLGAKYLDKKYNADGVKQNWFLLFLSTAWLVIASISINVFTGVNFFFKMFFIGLKNVGKGLLFLLKKIVLFLLHWVGGIIYTIVEIIKDHPYLTILIVALVVYLSWKFAVFRFA